MTTHLMEEVEELRFAAYWSDLARGKLVALGTVPELRAATGNPNMSMDEVFG